MLTLGPAWATTPRELPPGSSVKVGKKTLRGYTLEEFKTILHIHADYKSWHAKIPKLETKILKLEQLANNQVKQISLLGSSVEILKSERKLLTKKWENENRLRHECENKPAFGSWLAWGSAGAVGALATVLVIVLATRD